MQEKLENKQNNISNHVFLFPPFVCMSQVKNITGCGRNEVYHLIFFCSNTRVVPLFIPCGSRNILQKMIASNKYHLDMSSQIQSIH